MRYLRIFALSLQEVFEARSRLIVWILWAAITPLTMILFWRGANSLHGWIFPEIASYYLLVVIMSVFLMCHHEEKIATVDIKEGGLTAYLLKPFSYLKLKFFNEVSYRLIQGFFSLLLLIIFIAFFPQLFVFTKAPDILFLSFIISFNAVLLTFIFKTCIGLLAFWMTEARGAFETVNMTVIIFSGTLMPLAFFPHWLEQISYVLPFPYMIYFPIIALGGKLTAIELLQIIGGQFIWIILFYSLYKWLWREGVKQYTAVGQ